MTTLTSCIEQSREFEDSLGKTLLWCMLAAFTTTDATYTNMATKQGFISRDVGHFTCKQGIVVYSVIDGQQIGVNIVIPSRVALLPELMTCFSTVINPTSFVIDYSTVKTHTDAIPAPLVVPQFFVSGKAEMKALRLDEETLYVGTHRRDVVRFISPSEISDYRPLAASLAGAHDDDEMFWFSVDGRLLVMKNKRNVLQHIVFEVNETHQSSMISNSAIRRAMDIFDASLPTAQRCTYAFEAIKQKKIPFQIRRHMALIMCSIDGISDTKIRFLGTVFRHLKAACADNDFTGTIVRLLKAMESLETEPQSTGDVKAYIRQISNKAEQCPLWRQWTRSSSHVLAVIGGLPISLFQTVCTWPHIVDIANRVVSLAADWDRGTIARARALCITGVATYEIRTGFDALLHQWDDHIATLEYEGTAKQTPKAHAHTSLAATAEERRLVVPDSSQAQSVGKPALRLIDRSDATLDDMCHDIAQRFSLDVQLIGSGVFWKGKDIDIIVCVPEAQSLEDAVDYVVQKTGWTLTTASPNADHIKLLQGTHEGMPIDAQVWRGESPKTQMTNAEKKTARALELTRKLRHEGWCLRHSIRLLHAWFEAAGLKNHMLCGMPGIAITSIAIALAARCYLKDADDSFHLRTLLKRLVDALSTSMPCIDLEEGVAHVSAYKGMPSTALQVTAYGTLLNTRTTASTTRTLYTMATYALQQSDSNLLLPNVYNAHRRHVFVSCGFFQASDLSSIAMHLPGAAWRMDHHEVFDAIDFQPSPLREGAFEVFVRLLCTAPSRYGFKAPPLITTLPEEEARCVEVSVDDRKWFVPIACNADGDASRDTHSVDVGGRMLVNGVCIVNAPFLIADVQCAITRFGSWLWSTTPQL